MWCPVSNRDSSRGQAPPAQAEVRRMSRINAAGLGPTMANAPPVAPTAPMEIGRIAVPVRSAAIGVTPGAMRVGIHGAIAVEIPGAIRSETAALPVLILERSNASCYGSGPNLGSGHFTPQQLLGASLGAVLLFRLVSHEIRGLIKSLGKAAAQFFLQLDVFHRPIHAG